jgi:hypothetical protein
VRDKDIGHYTPPLEKQGGQPQQDAGIGKESTSKEGLQLRVTQLEDCLRALSGGLIEDLRAIPNPENSWVSKGISPEKDFTVAQLVEDVQNLTPRGLEHLRLWGNAQQTLRKLGKK